MDTASIREEHGVGFATELPDGRAIPWSLLSIGDYLYYDRLLKSGQYPQAYIEDEIFRKCVKSEYFRDKIGELKAGTVSNVATAIMSYSGPHTIDELNYVLDLKRLVASEIIHDIVGVICQSFPAYKPEDVYDMDYDTLMFRLAQAESKLLRTGMIQERITFHVPTPEGEEQPAQEKGKNTDLLERFYEQEGIVDPYTKSTPKPTVRPTPRPPSSKPKQTIISTDDIKEHQMQYSGHEQDDRMLLEHDMVKNTAKYYKGYLDQLQKDGKITFKTDKERTEAALKRSRKYEKVINKINESRSEEDKKLLELTIEHRKKKQKTRLRTKGLSVRRK